MMKKLMNLNIITEIKSHIPEIIICSCYIAATVF
jgi:hypothetical protein